jgi:hypothetical protein
MLEEVAALNLSNSYGNILSLEGLLKKVCKYARVRDEYTE